MLPFRAKSAGGFCVFRDLTPVKPETVSRGGSRHYRDAEAARRLGKTGLSPLETMVLTMRAIWAEATDQKTGDIIDIKKAVEASAIAVQAAPYMHPRLQHIQADVDNSHRIKIVHSTPLTEEEFERIYAQEPKLIPHAHDSSGESDQ
jgi:hypothetical protein